MVQYDTTTLMIRHFPVEVSKEEKIDFFTHFGAVDIRCLDFKNKKNGLIFARFETSAVADAVLKRLHQTEVLGQRLSVEFIRNKEQIENLATEKSSGEEILEDVASSAKQKHFEHFLQKLNSWCSVLNFNQPPPIHLKYQYPPPTQHTLTNIVRALATVPKFYTQVLHLMNRMNLPCPFAQDVPLESSLVVVDEQVCNKDIVQGTAKPKGDDMSSSEESELPSDDGNECGGQVPVVVVKRRRLSGRAQVKRPKLVRPPPVPPQPAQPKPLTAPQDVFDTSDIKEAPQPLSQRKIEVKLSHDLQSIQQSHNRQTDSVASEGFEKIEPSNVEHQQEKVEEEKVEEQDMSDSVISAEELAANRISTRDQHILPVFKNYQPGLPSCRLYIKNLSKAVVGKDLHHIYRRYFLENLQEEQGTMFDIRLMQEGRMKGQAFITLQTVAQAEIALKETNGYILKGKPMVVQFARSAKMK